MKMKFSAMPRGVPRGPPGGNDVLAATESIAAYAIVVDAKDERGRRFYEAHGFISLPSRPHRLFLLTETAAAALEAAL